MKTFPKPYTKNQSINVRPEVELLLSCARTQIDDERAQRIKSLVKEDIDWQYLIEIASRHGLISLLYANINAITKEAVPEADFAQIRSFFYANAQRNFFLTEELVKIFRLVQEHGISSVPYKGPVLAVSLYGNIALRPSGDLDIVVQQPDVFKFKDLLISQGYRPKDDLTEAEEIVFLQSKSEHAYSLVHDDKQILIEIHWRITPEYTSPIETKHFWEKLEPFCFGGTTISNLALEDWLPILCVHASRHRWERLIWLCDIAELIRVCPGINWERVIQQATVFGCRRVLFLGLFLASYLLGARIPTEVLQRIKADTEVNSLASEVCEELFQDVNAHQRFSGKMTVYQIRVRERLQDKLLYLESFLRWLMTGKK